MKTLRNLKTDIVIVLGIASLPIIFIGELIYNKIRGF